MTLTNRATTTRTFRRSVSVILVFLAGCTTLPSGEREHLGDVWFGRHNFNVPLHRTGPLDEAAARLEADSDQIALLVGLSYETERDALNMRYSERRAQAAKDYLIEKGIAPDRVITAPRGDRDPDMPYSEARQASLGNRVKVYVVRPASGP